MLQPDFQYANSNNGIGILSGPNLQSGTIFGHSNDPSLAKLFEDPDERENRIKSSIARSRLNKNKRQRLNSGTSNQSKVRSSTNIESASTAGNYHPYLSSRNLQGGQVINSDLLKRFSEDVEKN